MNSRCSTVRLTSVQNRRRAEFLADAVQFETRQATLPIDLGAIYSLA